MFERAAVQEEAEGRLFFAGMALCYARRWSDAVVMFERAGAKFEAERNLAYAATAQGWAERARDVAEGRERGERNEASDPAS